MRLAVPALLAGFMVLYGLSLAFQAGVWVQVAREAVKEPVRLFPVYTVFLFLGLMIVSSPRGEDPVHKVALALGWLMVVKSSFYLVLRPDMGFILDFPNRFLLLWVRAWGVAATGLGAWMAVRVWHLGNIS